MKRSWLPLVATVIVGLLAGIAVAGRPDSVDQTALPPPTSTPPSTAPSTSTTPVESSTTTSTAPSTTESASTTTAPPTPEVTRVLAVNGTKRSGIARRTADTLIAAGYLNTTPTDSIDTVEVSTVYYREGFQADAEGVATALGLDPTGVVPLDQPISAVDDQADVVVAIGNDFQE